MQHADPAPTGRTGRPEDRVVVAVLTYRRPDCLARIVPLVLSEARRVGPGVRVLVVDNDPDAGGREFVLAQLSSRAPELQYVHEPEPGIAAARNRALEEARSFSAHAVAFIDDDEEPGTGWLAALVGEWQRSGAAAVTGPVEPVFATRATPWVLASERFARRSRLTGAVVRSAASNNLLLDLTVLSRLDLSFDPSFGLTGGEDTLLTHDLTRRGGVIRWSEDAVVLDHIPPERVTRSWILRREFRSGTTYARMELNLSVGLGRRTSTRAALVARGLVRATGSAVRWSWGTLLRDVEHRARGACRAVANLGLVAGALGVEHREYRR